MSSKHQASAAASETIKKRKQNFLDSRSSITSGLDWGRRQRDVAARPDARGSTVCGSGPAGMQEGAAMATDVSRRPARIAVEKGAVGFDVADSEGWEDAF